MNQLLKRGKSYVSLIMDMERAINTQVAQRATKYFLHHVYILAKSRKEYKFALTKLVPILVIAYTILYQLSM